MNGPTLSSFNYVKATVLSIKGTPQFGGESFIQKLIADDPSVLGLGPLELKDRERIQPGAGRVDLVLKHPEDDRWYEVEIQLGATNESHIIRTIEYWDNERRRYPNIEHVAVIVAEKITNRFFNVIGLFNQHIPIIAIQMTALDVAGKQTVLFTRILDHAPQKLADREEEATGKGDWKLNYAAFVLHIAEELESLSSKTDPGIRLKFNKQFVGVTINNKPNNFFVIEPLAKFVRIKVRLEQTAEIDALIVSGSFEVDYDPIEGRYRLPLREGDVQKHRTLLSELIRRAYYEWTDKTPMLESSSREIDEVEVHG